MRLFRSRSVMENLPPVHRLSVMENLPPVHRLPGGYGCQIYSLPPYADTGARNAALGAVLINLHHKMLGTWPQAETVVAMIEAFTGEKLEKP